MSAAQRTPVGDLPVCPNDGEPVIFTFEYPGAEYVCVVCGWLGDVFAPSRADATPTLVARSDELHDQHRSRTGRVVRPAPTGTPPPVCKGCGTEATGRLDASGKPAHWYTRTRGGVKEFACSRECIGRDLVMPW